MCLSLKIKARDVYLRQLLILNTQSKRPADKYLYFLD
jgi:hypothetical protein